MKFILARRETLMYSLIVILKNLLPAALSALVVLRGFGLIEVIYMFVSVEVFLFFGIFLNIYKNIGFVFPRFSKIRSFFSYSLPLIPQSISSWITNASDRYIIALVLSSSASVGIYAAGYGIGSLAGFFILPITNLLLPVFSEMWEKGKMHELGNHFRYSLKYFLALGIPSVFGLTVLAKPFILIVAGNSFLGASTIIPLVALGFVFHGVYVVNGR
ncbi:MAG: oligosaccharide flippase family protein, partial [Candidatus Aenigmatarchaeota archaeon]